MRDQSESGGVWYLPTALEVLLVPALGLDGLSRLHGLAQHLVHVHAAHTFDARGPSVKVSVLGKSCVVLLPSLLLLPLTVLPLLLLPLLIPLLTAAAFP